LKKAISSATKVFAPEKASKSIVATKYVKIVPTTKTAKTPK
jgi:hypothetical protein